MTHHIAPNDTINKNTPAEMANQILSETRADTIKMMIKNRPNVIKNVDKTTVLLASSLSTSTHYKLNKLIQLRKMMLEQIANQDVQITPIPL